MDFDKKRSESLSVSCRVANDYNNQINNIQDSPILYQK